ncbi:ferredoxin-NADP reductase [Peribacillus deserti]|uniref:Ferredoxin-NADP reductase n=1 Tax=Peribacillus deserti TaxID=673318 RepID=A0ABS2QKD2_9BACI|nr:PDR/VanB family oxidoreductase [Peribacillus deserti]MBM7693624.1 ferredoxin-NADP reductase [Peribacillus deserti]
MYKENTIPVVVKTIQIETPFVKRFTLTAENGYILPGFSGGSHITAYIEGSEGLLERAYSLTSYGDNNESYEISIHLSETSRGSSSYWHRHMKIGDKLRISYPKNYFQLSYRAKHHVFYAAGIGITPFLSMMAELCERGASFELHYAAKSREFCAFYHLLRSKFPRQCHFYFSCEKAPKKLTYESLQHHPIGTHVYFCGPESFISSFKDAAIALGYPYSSVHYERFTARSSKSAAPFLIELLNGETIPVSKEQTLLEALLEKGMKVPYSCRAGRCGTCELKVLKGEIDHYDEFLSDEQRNSNSVILSCVSRAKSEKLLLEYG